MLRTYTASERVFAGTLPRTVGRGPAPGGGRGPRGNIERRSGSLNPALGGSATSLEKVARPDACGTHYLALSGVPGVQPHESRLTQIDLEFRVGNTWPSVEVLDVLAGLCALSSARSGCLSVMALGSGRCKRLGYDSTSGSTWARRAGGVSPDLVRTVPCGRYLSLDERIGILVGMRIGPSVRAIAAGL